MSNNDGIAPDSSEIPLSEAQPPLKVAINCSTETGTGPDGWRRSVDFVREAERLGVDVCWSAEAWGADAVSPLAYLAARTERIRLGAGVFQLFNRTPATVAMTALTLAALSGNRFILGLGASGPRIVEGLQGLAFHRPLRRLEETVEIVRRAFAGERLGYDGEIFRLPLPGGDGRALRLAHEPNPHIPIYLATLGPRALELTGRVADGWLGTAFVPEAAGVSLDHIRSGARSAGRDPAVLDLHQGGEVAFGDDVERMVAARKPGMAFTLGGMGSASANFYNDAYSRQGFAEEAATVQRLWLAGRRDEAAAAVPDELILATTLIGTDEMVLGRLRAIHAAGITTVRLYPAGATLDEQVATLGRAMDLVAGVNAEVAK